MYADDTHNPLCHGHLIISSLFFGSFFTWGSRFLLYSNSRSQCKQIANGRNVITWSVMHELAHSYCCGYAINGRPLVFDSDYKFNDEYFTNARGLTAIYNCDNLRDTDIHFHYENKDEGICVDLYNKYDNIAQDVCTYYTNDYYFFKFAFGLTKIGWDNLETFFAANTDNVSDLSECKDVARVLNDYIGINVPVTNNDYLKMANSFRKLMILEKGSYDKDKFSSFMRNKFSKDMIRFIVEFLGYNK